MNRVLILFAHPRFEKSKYNRALLAGVETIDGVTLHDLYEAYPDFNIDVEKEKTILTGHDVIVWHFPFYMFGTPALLKQWMDTVLEHGWAHGSKGTALAGKTAFVALTAGGSRDVYEPTGHYLHTLREFLLPFEQTALLCKMRYWPPFAVHGTYLLSDQELAVHAALYHRLLKTLVRNDLHLQNAVSFDYVNDWLTSLPDGGRP